MNQISPLFDTHLNRRRAREKKNGEEGKGIFAKEDGKKEGAGVGKGRHKGEEGREMETRNSFSVLALRLFIIYSLIPMIWMDNFTPPTFNSRIARGLTQPLLTALWLLWA